MSVATEVIADNYLKNCFEVHCEYNVSNGNLEEDCTVSSECFRSKFGERVYWKALITQRNETVSVKLSTLGWYEPFDYISDVFIIKCDGSKVYLTEKSGHIPSHLAHEYLHGGSQILFRFKIDIDDETPQGNQSLWKLFTSIDGEFNDFQIQAVGGSIKVIKNVLAVKWKYFASMMEPKGIEYAENKWVIEDVNVEIMKDIAGYVYCDAITLEDSNQAIKIIEAGHRYGLEALVFACSKYLVAEVHPGNVLTLLVLSDKYNLANLKEKCLTFVPKVVSGKDMEDMDGYSEYIKYFNHVKLTQACFQKAVREMMLEKKCPQCHSRDMKNILKD
ncbi:Protein maternal effect lethal 26 [Halotydeus destructor]|nr:Protein maternal effect lethal 26 [Halotydeus destructor]